MIIVILVILLILCIISGLIYRNGDYDGIIGVSFGITLLIICIAVIIFLMVQVSSLSVIDQKIEMYEQENTKIEQQIETAVTAYQQYEKDVFTSVKPNSYMQLVSLYPELKSDTLVNSFCKEIDDYAIKILRGVVTAEDFFVDIFALDETDDIWNPQIWIKANPFLCAPGNENLFEILKTDAQTAKDMGGMELRDFLTKALNMWVQNSDDMFINAEKWSRCGSEKTLEEFRGCDAWVGIDLSSGGDLTTYSLEFDKKDGIYLYSHSFMPKGRLQEHIETDLAPYDLWEQMELITVTGGISDFKNDYKFIIEDLRRIREKYDINFLGIGIDPHNADGILSDLESFGCPVVIVTQSCKSLNDATVDMQLLVKSEKIEYNKNNELLTWSFLNAKIVRNSFDEIKVDKKPGQRFKRIDPVDACIDAHACKLKNVDSNIVNVDDEMESYLKAMGWKNL